MKCAVTEVDPALLIPCLERSQQIEQDPAHGAGSSCLGSHTAFQLCQRKGRETERGCAAGAKSPPKKQGGSSLKLRGVRRSPHHRHMNPWLLEMHPHNIPRQITLKNMNKTTTLMEATLCPPPPQLQDRQTLLQGQTHTGGVTLHGEQNKPSSCCLCP